MVGCVLLHAGRTTGSPLPAISAFARSNLSRAVALLVFSQLCHVAHGTPTYAAAAVAVMPRDTSSRNGQHMLKESLRSLTVVDQALLDCGLAVVTPSPYATNKANLIEILTYCRARA